MFCKNSKLTMSFLLLVIFASPQLYASRLAAGEYSVANGSFEDSASFDASGWSYWKGDSLNTITVNSEPNKSYYGAGSAKLFTNSLNTVIFQEINIGTADNSPQIGDAVQGGAWVMFDPVAAGNSGQVLVQVKYVIGSTPYLITSSVDIPNKQANKWYYLLTETDDANNGRTIPMGAEKIQIVVDARVSGTVYVDFAQCGKIGSFTGNPSKLAMVEYQTWFRVPEFIPDAKRFADANYTGFASYNAKEWEHWQWGWMPDGGYNSDPGLYKQIGIKKDHVYTMIDGNFEDPCYADLSKDGWRRFPLPGDANYPYTTNVWTNESGKAYDGQGCVKIHNQRPGSDEGWCRQWISCQDLNHNYPVVPNENEFIQASVMANFSDVNLSAGAFWVQVDVYHDPDCNSSTSNDAWTTIAKSYEYISPEYVEKNSDANGWVKIVTRPVNKGVIPWWSYGVQVSIHFWYQGTVYIDNVQVGEAEYSNVQRQIACADYPIVGPYDSTDPDLIDYHLDLCRAMGFDAMLINYYGNSYAKEDYQRQAFDTIALKADSANMKICAFYEPKVHLKGWGDIGCYNITSVNDLNSVQRAWVNAYIDDVTEYNDISEITDVNTVMHYIKMAAVQDDIEYVLQTWGGKKSYLTYQGKPVIAIFGLYASKFDDPCNIANRMDYQDWADIKANLMYNDSNYDFVLVGDGVPGGWPDYSQWFSPFTGMMNWYMVDDVVRDRMFPTEQDVFARSRDIVNQLAVDWKNDGQDRFAIGLTFPQFNDEGVGAWGPFKVGQDGTQPSSWKYYVNRTPVWDGDFYRENNAGLIAHANDIDWFVVATFNDWNEGTSIEPSVENGYMHTQITQAFIAQFKGVSLEPNEPNLMRQITEKYINSRVHNDVGTGISKYPDPTGNRTYYRVSIYQFDSQGNYINEFPLPGFNWITSTGTLTSSFTGCSANLASYVPCIRLSTASGMGRIKVDYISAGGWTENFSTVDNWQGYETAEIASDGSVATITDPDGNGNVLWTGNRISYTSGDTMTIKVDDVYDGSGAYYSGAACLKTVLNYEGFNTYTQDQLHSYASACNDINDTTVIDPTGMYLAMNNYELNSRYNYAAIKDTTLADAYKTLCFWMTYSVPGVSPRPEKMPAMIPLGGNYRNWVVVNGISISGDNPQTGSGPHSAGIEYTVNGFWITDTAANGLGKDVYITAAALSDYYVPINISDSYHGYYVSVCEPTPAGYRAKVNIPRPKEYKNFKACRGVIVAAALKGLKDNLPSNDGRGFGRKTKPPVAKEPVLSENGRSYTVTFVESDGGTTDVVIDAKTGAFRQAKFARSQGGSCRAKAKLADRGRM